MRRGRGPVRWGEPRPGPVARLVGRLLRALRSGPNRPGRLPPLAVALRQGGAVQGYLAAERSGDDRMAAEAASEAMERAIVAADWWAADAWAHRALWHFEQAGEALGATRVARRIGDLRTEAGDPASARRYYAEAIGEARDIGAEREEGLAALGLGRAHLWLGDATTARRLAAIAADLLERAGAPADELAAATELRGVERVVGEGGT